MAGHLLADRGVDAFGIEDGTRHGLNSCGPARLSGRRPRIDQGGGREAGSAHEVRTRPVRPSRGRVAEQGLAVVVVRLGIVAR
ncbi:MAG: hypothetical protein KGL43_05595, partial [Burkholderiales bacterium]|nr:hypothetical protein [Burkholderiales bacterium]